MSCVYLIHFDEKLHHAQHYIGWTKYSDPWRRIQHHFNGRGARLTKAVRKAGIKMRLVRIWKDGDLQLERDLKKKHSGKVLCPLCNKKMKRFLIRREIVS
jgi:predicted GIY-YIG superfamily endonuclease